MNLSENILILLKEKPGQKARELASQVGVDKSEVNSILYGKLRNVVYRAFTLGIAPYGFRQFHE